MLLKPFNDKDFPLSQRPLSAFIAATSQQCNIYYLTIKVQIRYF